MSDQPVHENTIGPGLVNQALLFRNVLPRLYLGTVWEFLRELFQNSYRAQATRVEISTMEPGCFFYHDNGHGISGVEGLFHLLCVANSSYEDEFVEVNQRPMGIGFYSLLMHQNVHKVSIMSNGITLEIDTRRLREDEEYRNSWVERVQKQSPREAPGFSLLVEGNPSLTEEVRAQMNCELPTPSEYWRQDRPFGPARGYAGLLAISLDGEPVETELPAWFLLPKADIVDWYEGNCIRIALSESDVPRPAIPEFEITYYTSYSDLSDLSGDRAGLRACWYGQPLADRGISSVRVFLDVRAGAPITPQAPTRQRLVQDEKLIALYAWVRDRIFTYVCQELPLPSPEMVNLLYKLDQERAERECPWVLLRPRRGVPAQPAPSQSQRIESHDDLERLTIGHERVIRRDALQPLLILEDEVVVVLPGTHPVFKDPYTGKLPEDATPDLRPLTFANGLASFLAALHLQAYQAQRGAPGGSVLWWKPGASGNEHYTEDLGWWGIGSKHLPPQEWQEVPTGSLLFVYDGVESWNIEYLRFFAGLASKQEFIRFLQHYARAFWCLDDDDDDGAHSDESFDYSVDELVRALLGDTIDAQVVRSLVWAVSPFFGDLQKMAAVRSVEMLRGEEDRISGIRVRLESGEIKDLSLY